MTNIPHFDYPFRLRLDGHAAVCEQDSIEDIESCLASVLLTEQGQRVELPEWGITSPLFDLQPLDLQSIYDDITEQEPRALVSIAQQTSPVDYLTALVEVDLKQQQPPTIGET